MATTTTPPTLQVGTASLAVPSAPLDAQSAGGNAQNDQQPSLSPRGSRPVHPRTPMPTVGQQGERRSHGKRSPLRERSRDRSLSPRSRHYRPGDGASYKSSYGPDSRDARRTAATNRYDDRLRGGPSSMGRYDAKQSDRGCHRSPRGQAQERRGRSRDRSLSPASRHYRPGHHATLSLTRRGSSSVARPAVGQRSQEGGRTPVRSNQSSSPLGPSILDIEIDPRVLDRDSPLSPIPPKPPSAQSCSDHGVVMNFVPLPRTLHDSLWDGPSAKRKRHNSSRSRSRSPKRARWEDSLTLEQQEWVDQMRLQYTAVMLENAANDARIEVLEQHVSALQNDLARARWMLAEKDGTTGGKHQVDFEADEVERLKNPPARPERTKDYIDGMDDSASDVDSEAEKRAAKKARREKQKKIIARDKAASRVAPSIQYPTAPFMDHAVERWCSDGYYGDDTHAAVGDNGDELACGLQLPTPKATRRPSPAPTTVTPSARLHKSAAMPLHSAIERPSQTVRADSVQRGCKAAPPPRLQQQQQAGKKRTPGKPALSMSDVVVVGTVLDAPAGYNEVLQHNDAYAEAAAAAAIADEELAQGSAGFIAMSIDDVLDALPAARRKAALREDCWQMTNGGYAPLPLGKFGQPFCKGWLWGEIHPRRVFKDSYTGEKIARDGDDFRQLAYEAVQLPFSCRSVTQRVVVGWAHNDGILPVPGWRAEPDIMFQCRSNPDKVAFAVRRQNTVDKWKPTVYTEWDVIDLDCNLLLRLARPESLTQKDRKKKGENKDESKNKASDWMEWVWAALVYGAKSRLDYVNVEEYPTGPCAYEGNGNVHEVFLHLRRCGFALERMTHESGVVTKSELGAYVARYRNIIDQQKNLLKQLDEMYGPKRALATEREYLSANTKLEGLQPGRPIVRTMTPLNKSYMYFFGKDGVLRFTEKKKE
ncbi:hypothetical protein AURDEDRAFT_170223 [Auricularia subglabra TFB-10046 SS5]|nr:hypothetical protein AURDEDRAFT_170223 [Auricularia subglabra TFB-10046 SS5]